MHSPGANVLFLTFCSVLVGSASVVGPAGHWQGFILVPAKEIAVQVDLARGGEGEWRGTIDISEENQFPLSDVTVKANSVSFAVKGRPGNPVFKGALSADGQSITGKLTQGGTTLPFALKRTGEPRLEAATRSTKITKEFAGQWQGALQTNGQQLHLMLTMANEPDGGAAGTIFSVDHGGVEMPVTTITQHGSNITIELKSIGAVYKGWLKDGVMSGEWTQNGVTLPLAFKR